MKIVISFNFDLPVTVDWIELMFFYFFIIYSHISSLINSAPSIFINITPFFNIIQMFNNGSQGAGIQLHLWL